MKQLLVTVIIAASACIGCSPKMSPDFGWDKVRWLVVEIKEVPVQLSGTNRDAFLDFSIPEKKFNGNGGCNRINGDYTIDKNHIHFTSISSTKMNCPDIAFENTFLSLLEKVNKYEVQNNTMLLKDDNKVLVMLKVK
jgi:heat shock protein HslJ